jgi:hypothetical protein
LNSLYENHAYPEALSYEKVFKFLFYQAYHEQNKHGGWMISNPKDFSDCVAYDVVSAQYTTWFNGGASDTGDPPEPTS